MATEQRRRDFIGSVAEAVARSETLRDYAATRRNFPDLNEGDAVADVAKRYVGLITGESVTFDRKDVALLQMHAKVLLRRADDLAGATVPAVQNGAREDERVGSALMNVAADIRATLAGD